MTDYRAPSMLLVQLLCRTRVRTAVFQPLLFVSQLRGRVEKRGLRFEEGKRYLEWQAVCAVRLPSAVGCYLRLLLTRVEGERVSGRSDGKCILQFFLDKARNSSTSEMSKT